MAIVGKLEMRPYSTTSYMMYRAVVCRCLLCGKKAVYARAHDETVRPFCDCYGNKLQEIRIIPDAR